MSTIPELPQNLWSIRDAAIDSIINGTEAPNLQPIYDWLENDGWDALVGIWSNEEMAINLEYLAYTEFDADELAYDMDTDVKDITNEMRVARARELIDGVKYDGYVSVHSYKLAQGNEKSPVIGCVMETQGQLGESVGWWGAFKNDDGFYQSLRQCDTFLLSDIDSLADEKILSLWNK